MESGAVAARGRSASMLRSVARAAPLKALTSFGIVGLGGMVIDVALFNALRLGAFSSRPLTASVLSASAAIVFNWVGNRFWTFREERRADIGRELVEYGAVAVLGLGVSLLCLAVSHYALGLHSVAADNVAKNVVGLGLGTCVRFTLSRWWIWNPSRRTRRSGEHAVPHEPAPGADPAPADAGRPR